MGKPVRLDVLKGRAAEVAEMLKTLSHPNRLLIACRLMEGEYSVSEIEHETGVRQPVLSRELARLRSEGLVSTRREAKLVFYKLSDPRLAAIIGALCHAFSVQGSRVKLNGRANSKLRTRP